MPFSNLPPLLSEALAARGYAAPTPVQAAVLEPEAEGRDLLVSAQTGSGKTVAFGLAMAGQLLEDDRLPIPGKPLALIIAPTRELALQVSRELIWLFGKAHAPRRHLRRRDGCVQGTPLALPWRAYRRRHAGTAARSP